MIVEPDRTQFFLFNPRIRTDFFVQPEAKLINCATQTSSNRVILFLFESTAKFFIERSNFGKIRIKYKKVINFSKFKIF
jgi:hypothetical protein